MATLVPPPAYRGTKHDQFDLNTMNDDSNIVARIWDHLALYGPMTRLDLESANPVVHISAVWREYERFHPEVTVKDAGRLEYEAGRWYTGHIVERCLRRGWMTEQDGLLTVAAPPPQHKALSTYGGEQGAKARLDQGNLDVVRDVLNRKTNIARIKPSADDKARLRASLERFGQMMPVVIWEGSKTRGFPETVVDGQTRLELLKDLGVEPKIEYLPGTMSPVDVLMLRIDFETARKTLTKESRDEYIATLAKAGVEQVEIARQMGVNQSTVSRILARVTGMRDAYAVTEPVEEWLAMQERGWSLRDIANEYGVNHMKVDRALKRHEMESDEVALPSMPKVGTQQRTALAIAARGPISRIDLASQAGMTGDRHIRTLVTRGLLEEGEQEGTVVTALAAQVQLTDAEQPQSVEPEPTPARKSALNVEREMAPGRTLTERAATKRAILRAVDEALAAFPDLADDIIARCQH